MKQESPPASNRIIHEANDKAVDAYLGRHFFAVVRAGNSNAEANLED